MNGANEHRIDQMGTCKVKRGKTEGGSGRECLNTRAQGKVPQQQMTVPGIEQVQHKLTRPTRTHAVHPSLVNPT